MTTNIFISYKQWDSYTRRCERAALKENGRARSATTISNLCGREIVELRPDKRLMLVRKTWREAMRTASNPDNMPNGYEMRGKILTPTD